MTRRPYTGHDRDATGKRPGLESLVAAITEHTGAALWNNGTWGVRSMRGKGKANPSVHGTGRAADLSWRPMGDRRKGSNYAEACRVADLLIEHADALGLEALFDYYPRPYGRGWKCDRDGWRVYTSRAFSGAPGGDWLHIEVSNAAADDPGLGARFLALVGDGKPAPAKPAEGPRPYPGRTLRKGSTGDDVRFVQRVIGATVDGQFGPQTERAVRAFQRANPAAGPVDGLVGPKTWAALVARS